MFFGSLIILPLAAAAIWLILNAREKNRLANGLPRHSGLRLVFASIAIFLTVFSGGCGSLFLFAWIADGMPGSSYAGWQVISILTLPPLAVGALVWWLTMRRDSKNAETK
jgi:hypothetical protein